MVNSQVTQEIIRALKLNVQKESVPNPVPVVIVDLKHSSDRVQIRSVTSSNLNGNSTLIAGITGQNIYLLGLSLSRTKDVTADTTGSSVRVTIDGATREVLSMSGLTLTAQDKDMFINFPIPIKLDVNTGISLNSSRTAGSTYHSCNVYYFVDEVSNG